MTIEVEMRGPLSDKECTKLKNTLESNGIFKGKKERILIDYSTLMDNDNIRNRHIDVRARITNGTPELIIKLGKWKGSDTREEISILLEKGQFTNLVKGFAALGYKKGMVCVRNSVVYDYNGVEFAIVEVPNHSYYFEAEILVKEDKDVKRAQDKIKKLCAEMELRLFTDEKFFDYIEILNKEANEIFDIDKHGEDHFSKNYGT